jgi:alcohol dehydrogenase
LGCERVPDLHEGAVVEQLGAVAREYGLRQVLLVTDPGVKAQGHSERVRVSLEDAGVAVVEFSAVRVNPTGVDVEACAKAAPLGVDGFVAVGGGSAIDTAKGANFVLTNGGRIADYRGYGKASTPLLPLIAVPTTAGTGTEVQSYALIADAHTHGKMACGDPSAMPIAAFLDARLTVSLPREQTAYTGLDAVVHAVESAVCTARTEASFALSLEAFSLLATHLPTVLDVPERLPARAAVLRGAMLAGRAIELSMLGGAHAMANPLTARFDLPHGLAVGLMLPYVIRFNRKDPETKDRYAQLSDSLGGEPLDTWLEQMLANCGVPGLETFGVNVGHVGGLAREACAQWTAQFNPRRLDLKSVAALYSAALD